MEYLNKFIASASPMFEGWQQNPGQDASAHAHTTTSTPSASNRFVGFDGGDYTGCEFPLLERLLNGDDIIILGQVFGKDLASEIFHGLSNARMKIKALEADNLRMEDEAVQGNKVIEELRQQLTLAARAPPVPPSSAFATSAFRSQLSKEHPDPRPFGSPAYRSPDDLEEFLIKLNMKLMQNEDWWTTEVARMRYVYSMLEAKAATTFQAYLGRSGNFEGISTVDEMQDILVRGFGDKHRASKAFSKIIALKQGTTDTTTFLATFLNLTAIAKIDKSVAKEFLLRSTNPLLIDKLYNSPQYTAKKTAITLTEVVDLLRDIEHSAQSLYGINYLRKEHVTRGGGGGGVTPQTGLTPTHGDPMDLDAARLHNSNLAWTKHDIGNKRRAVTKEEKDARRSYQIQHNLCFYCDAVAHGVEECPKAAVARARKEARDAGQGKA